VILAVERLRQEDCKAILSYKKKKKKKKAHIKQTNKHTKTN
jgi:hypothetical protein